MNLLQVNVYGEKGTACLSLLEKTADASLNSLVGKERCVDFRACLENFCESLLTRCQPTVSFILLWGQSTGT